jgi:isoaspartyl peptidase/L-asparaginase-like protein (Ntn-hydrolase superfamily)
VKKPATLIEITNVYKGTGPGVATRQASCANASYCEEKEWAVGVSITVVTDTGDTSAGGGATLDIDSVNGTAVIMIGDERLTGQVSASSALSENSIWG